MLRRPPRSTRTDPLFPYTTLFRSRVLPQVGRDLAPLLRRTARAQREGRRDRAVLVRHHLDRPEHVDQRHEVAVRAPAAGVAACDLLRVQLRVFLRHAFGRSRLAGQVTVGESRSEEHTSELQSLMRISYAVFCLKKKKQ